MNLSLHSWLLTFCIQHFFWILHDSRTPNENNLCNLETLRRLEALYSSLSNDLSAELGRISPVVLELEKKSIIFRSDLSHRRKYKDSVETILYWLKAGTTTSLNLKNFWIRSFYKVDSRYTILIVVKMCSLVKNTVVYSFLRNLSKVDLDTARNEEARIIEARIIWLY